VGAERVARLDTGQPLIIDVAKNLGNGRIKQNASTHGMSLQRKMWFTVGYRSGDPPSG